MLGTLYPDMAMLSLSLSLSPGSWFLVLDSVHSYASSTLYVDISQKTKSSLSTLGQRTSTMDGSSSSSGYSGRYVAVTFTLGASPPLSHSPSVYFLAPCSRSCRIFTSPITHARPQTHPHTQTLPLHPRNEPEYCTVLYILYTVPNNPSPTIQYHWRIVCCKRDPPFLTWLVSSVQLISNFSIVHRLRGDPENKMGAKQLLLQWVNSKVSPTFVQNFKSDWRDGKVLARLTNVLGSLIFLLFPCS
jgi:hypothetical protein